MLFLTVLSIATLVARAVGARRGAGWRDAARSGMGVAMAVAGAAHLLDPTPFLQHLPPWVPAADFVVAASGLVEIALGAALFAPAAWRPLAGRALAAFLVAVFPANVYVALAGVEVTGQPGGVYPWLRLPLQALFVAWALWSTARQPVADDQPAPSEPARAGV